MRTEERLVRVGSSWLPARCMKFGYLGPNGEVWRGRSRRPTWLKQALFRGEKLADNWKARLNLGSSSESLGDDSLGPTKSREREETLGP
ncbi:H-NS family nucleoid-associated regulatory protein [Roseateles hydrophilus]|uniref:H-NS family nucleoid-associated regulatory protein n=1 Tax=Roseateles hydrophilus TaxID=2975054 RepID=UPI003BB00590